MNILFISIDYHNKSLQKFHLFREKKKKIQILHNMW